MHHLFLQIGRMESRRGSTLKARPPSGELWRGGWLFRAADARRRTADTNSAATDPSRARVRDVGNLGPRTDAAFEHGPRRVDGQKAHACPPRHCATPSPRPPWSCSTASPPAPPSRPFFFEGPDAPTGPSSSARSALLSPPHQTKERFRPAKTWAALVAITHPTAIPTPSC